jgi:hypothetical protein
MHVCVTPPCHPSHWHGPLYDLASGLILAVNLFHQFGWEPNAFPDGLVVGGWRIRGATMVRLACGEPALIRLAKMGSVWWIVEAAHGGQGCAVTLPEAITNCDNVVRQR